ncbi:MAG TPA: MlaD family protein [Solirubrobacteraceae bacterium]|nr:MlaD family protein [Solirubrobacteraceae bacterium]
MLGRLRRRGRRRGLSPFKAGAIALVALCVFVYLGFTKFANPFATPFTIHAVFANANGVLPGSPVRIAGVDVGQVSGVGAVPGCRTGGSTQTTDASGAQQCQAADVTMTIDSNGLPIHKDATFAVRPRTFLEGNFFVDLSPGTPEAPVAPSSWTFPIQQGIEPVQLDQVITSLQAPTRTNLQTLLQQFGTAVKKGGPSYNASIQYWLPAYEYSAVVSHDALGIQPNDLSDWLAEQGEVSGAIDTHPQNLENLITDFNTTAHSFAVENTALSQAVAELPQTLAAAIPALHALNTAFCSGPQVPDCAAGPLPQLAKALIPGVKSTGPMIDASLPFITQLRYLVSPSELRGLTADLAKTVPALSNLTRESIPLMANGVRPAATCAQNVILPWSRLTINDGHFDASNGFPARPVYVEAVDFLPGLAGESRDFDANGPYIRILGTGGTLTYSASPGLVGQSLEPLQGEQPQPPPGGKAPPLEPDVPCETQQPITDLSAPTGGPPAQESSDSSLTAPGASLRWDSAAAAALPEISQLAGQDGLKLGTASMPASSSDNSDKRSGSSK